MHTADQWIESLPDGHLGTLHTLETMRRLARKDYGRAPAQVVARYLADCGDVVGAAFRVARDCIRFVPDPPGIELVQDFYHSTISQAGDCDDKAVWLATALLAAGVAVRFVVQSYDGEFWANGWDHVYLEYYDFDRWRWVALDPTADGHTGIVADIGWRQTLPPAGVEWRFEV